MSEGNSNDGLWMLFFIIAIICAIFFGIWTLFKPQLLQGYIWVRQGEMTVASLWTEPDTIVDIGENNTMTFGEARQLMRTIDPNVMLQDDVDHWEIIHATSLVALKPMRIPFGILFLLMIFYAFKKSPPSKYRNSYNLDSLIEIQARTFKIIKPFVKFNPLKDVVPRAPGSPVPAELPLFAEALGPEEWCAKNKIPSVDGELDQDAMEEAFAAQLDKKWQGPKKLPPHLQVILAAFALKTSRKRVESDILLGEIAECWSHKSGLKLDRSIVSKARKILRNKDLSEKTISACNRHAYVSTALLGALEAARSEGGVLAPAQFVWLRGHQRALWYPLNNLGRNSFHIEALGTMSHYRAEVHVQRPIPKPMVKDAVMALSGYSKDPKKMQPIPQLDFSMIKNKKAPNKNKGVMKPAGT